MNTPTSVKLELTQKQLDMMVYMLGAIDLRTDPDTLTVAMDLRKKLKNALEVFKPKNKPKLDKYGKVMSEEEKAQEVAAQFSQGRNDGNDKESESKCNRYFLTPAKNP